MCLQASSGVNGLIFIIKSHQNEYILLCHTHISRKRYQVALAPVSCLHDKNIESESPERGMQSPHTFTIIYNIIIQTILSYIIVYDQLDIIPGY